MHCEMVSLDGGLPGSGSPDFSITLMVSLLLGHKTRKSHLLSPQVLPSGASVRHAKHHD
jgi:hypothetical protein